MTRAFAAALLALAAASSARGGAPSQTATETETPTETATRTATPTVTPPALPPFLWSSENAWRPATRPLSILFVLPDDGPVRLSVHGASGERVRELRFAEVSGFRAVSAAWDGNTEDGVPCASGVYVLRVTSGSRSLWRRVGLLR